MMVFPKGKWPRLPQWRSNPRIQRRAAVDPLLEKPTRMTRRAQMTTRIPARPWRPAFLPPVSVVAGFLQRHAAVLPPGIVVRPSSGR